MSVPGLRVVVRGGGDLGSGVVLRLHRIGVKVMVAELDHPLVVRRKVAFAEAIYSKEIAIEDAIGVLAETADEASDLFAERKIPVMIDPDLAVLEWFRPQVIVDARLLKRQLEPTSVIARMVIGLGPGFTAGKDCDAVVETKRGPTLGRVIWQGQAEPDSRMPEMVLGHVEDRVLRAPADGLVCNHCEIGQKVRNGQLLSDVNGLGIYAKFDGVIRGIVHDGLEVQKGTKIGDVDPRNDPQLCYQVSDKALAIGGGVTEAILSQQIFREVLGETPK